MNDYDVVVIGAGPAGIFTSDYILRNSEMTKVLMIEKGFPYEKRTCIKNCEKCIFSNKCNMLCGVGGAGLFSDGKLVCDLHSGGVLDELVSSSEYEKDKLVRYIVNRLKEFDGVSSESHIQNQEVYVKWQNVFKEKGLETKFYDVIHMGTNNLKKIIERFIESLKKNQQFKLLTDTEVIDVYAGVDSKSIVQTSDGMQYFAKHVVFGVGKTGSDWLRVLFTKNKIAFRSTNCYLGLRLETLHRNIEKLFKLSFDPKIWHYYGERKVKTHCFCRHGEVIQTNYLGFPVVGGHTPFTEKNLVEKKEVSEKSNFNILVSIGNDKKNVVNILTDFKEINKEGVVVQPLLEFLNNSTVRSMNVGVFEETVQINSRWANIRELLDKYEGMGSMIADFILKMSQIVPGIIDEKSLVYAPSVEWLMDSVEVDVNMETSHRSWFAVGDGAGLSQGIVHAAATGIIAAKEICARNRI